MISIEREKPRFSKEEEEAIKKAAHKVADMGQEAVYNVMDAKGTLFVQAHNLLKDYPQREGVMEDYKQIKSTINKLQAVQDEAVRILREKGEDDLSKLEEMVEKDKHGRYANISSPKKDK